MGKRALVTGVGRLRGIGAGIATGLADDGWDLVLSCWQPYDGRSRPGQGPPTIPTAGRDTPRHRPPGGASRGGSGGPGPRRGRGGPGRRAARAARRAGDVALRERRLRVLDTTVESFDRHYAVNVRATWLLTAAFARQLPEQRRQRHRADQRPHRRQPPVRRDQGRPGPAGPRRRPRARRPRSPRERDQPGPDRHRLDGRRHPRQRTGLPTPRPPRHPHRHRQPGPLPPLRRRQPGSTASSSTATAASRRVISPSDRLFRDGARGCLSGRPSAPPQAPALPPDPSRSRRRTPGPHRSPSVHGSALYSGHWDPAPAIRTSAAERWGSVGASKGRGRVWREPERARADGWPRSPTDPHRGLDAASNAPRDLVLTGKISGCPQRCRGDRSGTGRHA